MNGSAFNILNVNRAYFEIPMSEACKVKICFITHSGIYRSWWLPFGLRNFPTTFEKAKDIGLSVVRWKTGFVYMIDVIVFYPDDAPNGEYLDRILGLFRKASVSLNLKKLVFFRGLVEYFLPGPIRIFGHNILPRKLAVTAEQKSEILKSLFPVERTTVLSPFGACKVFRLFTCKFA